MNVRDIIENMTTEEVCYILEELGSAPPKEARDGLLFQTVCHCGAKHKLHYRYDNKSFFCYSECGSISNIFNLVMEVKCISFGEAYRYITKLLGISSNVSMSYGFKEEKIDNSFFNKFHVKETVVEELELRDEKVLNNFWDIIHQSWLDDGISIETMKRFNIKFDLLSNAIIIPHYDINGRLIGIRARNLNQNVVDAGMKYIPITYNGILYNYPTSLNLFGLNQNKENIKKYKKAIIGESEKFVMQHVTMYEDSVAVALNGSSLSEYQIKMLLDLGVESIVLALDKEFENEEEEERYKAKINRSFLTKLLPYFTVEIIWDRFGLLELKDAPTDKGKEIFEKLYKERIIVS